MGLLTDRIDNAKIDLKNEMIRYIEQYVIVEVETEEEIERLMNELEDITSDMLREILSNDFQEIVDLAVPVTDTDITIAWFNKSMQLQPDMGYDPSNTTKKQAIYMLIEDKLNKDFDEVFEAYVGEFIQTTMEDLQEMQDILYEENNREDYE
jgi:hypothetical protein